MAQKAGVSHTTVALALQNHHRISPQRRKQIQRLAKKMGYRPDPFLSALAAYRRKNGPARFQGVIAWINHWNQPARLRQFGEFEGYWQGAVTAARRFGYQLDEIVWPEDCSPKGLERILLARGVNGVLVPPHQFAPDWGDFDWRKFSVIRFGMSVPYPDSNLVTSDHFRAMVMAVTRVHQYGYRRIGLAVDEELDDHLGGNYQGGFLWAQKKLGCAPALPPWPASGTLYRSHPEKELRSLEQWLARYRPDAVLTTQVYLPDLIRKPGFRIPQDVAVAGTSVRDIPVDAGINQHAEAIGTIAAEMLVKQLGINERGEPPEPCRILVESSWRDGKSLPRLS